MPLKRILFGETRDHRRLRASLVLTVLGLVAWGIYQVIY